MTLTPKVNPTFVDRYHDAVQDIRPHIDTWISLLRTYVTSLPYDRLETSQDNGNSDRSYAEHELKAMIRDLNALRAVDDEITNVFEERTEQERVGRGLKALCRAKKGYKRSK